MTWAEWWPLLFTIGGFLIAIEAWDRMQVAEGHRRAARAREVAFQRHATQAIDLAANPDFELWTTELASPPPTA